MNRYKMVARALRPYSWLAWFLVAFVVAALTIALLMGHTVVVVVFAGLSAIPIAFLAWVYRQWEPSQLVPDMNSTFADVLVMFGLFLWALVSLFILAIDGLAVIRIGLALIAIAIGFWIGFGDRFKLILFISVGFIASLNFKTNVEQFGGAMWDLKFDRTQPWNGFISASSVLVGLGLLWLFHRSACRKVERNSNWLTKSSWLDTEIFIAQASRGSRTLPRMNSMLNASATWSPVDVIFTALATFGVGCFLVAAEGAVDAVAPLIWMCSLLMVSVPVVYFMNGLPKAFERLWLTGVKSTRIETARTLVVIAAYRALYLLALIAVALLIQSPKQLMTLAATYSILLFAFAISAVVLWVAARWYRLWSGISDQVALGLLGLLAVFAIVSLSSWEWLNVSTRELIVLRFGSLTSILIATLFAGVCWAFCIYAVPRCIVRETTLME